MDDLLRSVLLLSGLIYGFAAVFLLRSVARDRLLTQAISALDASSPPDAGERTRRRWLVVFAHLSGAAAMSMVLFLALAPWLFAASVLASLVYVGILAPRLVEPAEPPTEGARTKSLLQIAALAAVTLLAFAADRRGLLTPAGEALFRTALALAGFAALALYAFRLTRAADLRRAAPVPAMASLLFNPSPEPDDPQIDPAMLERMRIVLTPGWGRLPVLDASNGQDLSYDLYRALLTQRERDLLADWSGLFISLADPSDPRRAALTDPDGPKLLEERGRPIDEQVAARLGRDRVTFEPTPRPQSPHIDVRAVKVMADHSCDPLWHHGDERMGYFSPEDFGLSWNLARGLSSWAMAFDEGVGDGDGAAAHAAEGRELARTLAAELAGTGRADVPVTYQPPGGAPETIAG